MRSVFQKEKKCYYCGTTQNIEEHHIFFGNPNRKHSEKLGFKLYLCHEHHTGGDKSPHFNRDIDLAYKEMAQNYFEEILGDRKDFRRIFGKSYL